MPQLFADATPEQLIDIDWLHDAIAVAGLEHHGPCAPTHPQTWGGMRIWQTPIQFAPYLIATAAIGVRSYAELGVHAGGSMIATVDYFERFDPVEHLMAVDMELQSEPAAWIERRGGTAIEAQTQSEPVEAWLAEHEPDLVFIDAEHAYHGVKGDWEMVRPHARYVAFHDICEWSCPGPGRLWDEIDEPKTAFTDQYPGSPAPLHGIGLVGPLR